MKFSTTLVAIVLCWMGVAITGCAGRAQESLETPKPESTRIHPSSTSGLFLDAPDAIQVTPAPTFLRVRPTKINLGLLLNEMGEARPTSETPAILFNLFPDVTYTAVIEQVEFDGSGYSWVGYLKGVEYSHFSMIYLGEIFIAHIASPSGVYEVSILGEDIYLIVQINQDKLEGGDG